MVLRSPRTPKPASPTLTSGVRIAKRDADRSHRTRTGRREDGPPAKSAGRWRQAREGNPDRIGRPGFHAINGAQADRQNLPVALKLLGRVEDLQNARRKRGKRRPSWQSKRAAPGFRHETQDGLASEMDEVGRRGDEPEPA